MLTDLTPNGICRNFFAAIRLMLHVSSEYLRLSRFQKYALTLIHLRLIAHGVHLFWAKLAGSHLVCLIFRQTMRL